MLRKLILIMVMARGVWFQTQSPSHTGKLAVNVGGTVVFTATEGSNTTPSGASSLGRNAYTNCALSCTNNIPQPPNSGIVSHGQLWCNTSQIPNNPCGSFGTGVVSSVITGTGTTKLSNGNGAGGADSLTSITATYGGTAAGGCPVGINIPSGITGVSLPGAVPSSASAYKASTGPTHFNSSSLEPTKWNVATGDQADHYIRETCQKVNTTSVAGEHLEWDTNYNTSLGDYFGFGMDFDFPNSKLRICPQSCPSWHNVILVDAGGTQHTTISWPTDHWIYTIRYEHRNAGCTHTSGSNCFFYDKICFEDFTAGTAIQCYTMKDATTGTTPGGIPVNKSTWTKKQFALQHQWDVDGANANLVNNVDFDNLVAYHL